jgi:hypothetical protein
MRRSLLLVLLCCPLWCGCSALKVGFELDCPAFGKARWTSEGSGPAGVLIEVGATNAPSPQMEKDRTR